MRRHELPDASWALIEPLLPPNGRRGQPWHDHRAVVNGLLWRLRTGCPWRDIPERYGPWQTLYERWVRWRTDGTWDKILLTLQVRLDAEGKIDWDLWCVDGSHARASRAAAGAGQKGETPSRPTTRWAAGEAGLAPRSIWSLTAEAFPWPRSSAPARSTRPSGSSR
jgi:transposase